jgi:hypothetical protein
MVFFLVGGPSLWVASAVAILFAGGATIALGTLDAELFPTEVRGQGSLRADGTWKGNLVLNYQGVQNFADKVFKIEEKKPRIGFAVVHGFLGQDGTEDIGMPGLKDALARLRKFGCRCVLGFQSIAQVSSTYGSAAQTIVENCGNTLILRCSGSENGGTSQFASRLIGDREIVRRQLSRGSDREIAAQVSAIAPMRNRVSCPCCAHR